MEELHVTAINTLMDQLVTNTINSEKLPQHVAIIMDGNGRWAKKRGLARTSGHQAGVQSVRRAIEVCQDFNIPYLTLFAFSTENWNRPKVEVSFLMKLLSSTIQSETKELHDKNIRLNVIGELSVLPSSVLKPLNRALELTKNNTKATLTVALNYGSQAEILRTCQLLAAEVKSGYLDIKDINQKVFEENLYTKDIPNVDLLIRTSGEHRVSNFLLWQIAYAELYFSDVFWPDFSKEHFLEAIQNYSSRERRYGKTGDQIKSE